MYNDLLNIKSFTYQDLANNTLINTNLISNIELNSFQELNSSMIDTTDATFINKVNIDYKLPFISYDINFQDRIINYKCKYINYNVLLYNFPQLLDNEINYILNKYGIPNYTNDNITNTSYSTNIMYHVHWMYFMSQIKSLIGSPNININNLGLYNPYIDYNLLYSQINLPNISLVCHFIYFDEIERKKFATSKLEYVIETIDQNIFDINKSLQTTFSGELSFTKPTKELFWYIQPKIFNIGLTQYGQNTQLLFEYSNYYDFNIINNQNISLDKYNILINSNSQYNNYYFNVLPYKYLSYNLPNGIYYHTFSLYPEETQPSGTANLSIIKGKNYNITFNTNFIDEYFNNGNIISNNAKTEFNSNNPINYKSINNNMNINNHGLIIKLFAKSYNMFIIENGHGNLLFTV